MANVDDKNKSVMASVIVFIILVLLIVGAIAYFSSQNGTNNTNTGTGTNLGGTGISENRWECRSGQWVRVGNPTTPQPTSICVDPGQ